LTQAKAGEADGLPYPDCCAIDSTITRSVYVNVPNYEKVSGMMTSMRIVSWNVNGIRSLIPPEPKKPRVKKTPGSTALLESLPSKPFAPQATNHWEAFLKATKPDVFFLQETKAAPEQLSDTLREVPGFFSYFSSCKIKKGYSGVALYTKTAPLTAIYGIDIPEFDDEGRIVGAEYKDFWLLNVYFPNGGQGPHRIDYKLRFYDAFLSFCERLRLQKPVIFCGDVNTAHEEIDLARPKENEMNTGFLPEERAWLDEVISAGYVDSFRHFFPSRRDAYTYWDLFTRSRDRNVGWRIDYFFIAQEYAHHLKKAEIHTEVFGSDHCPVSITLD
jgi:exodeoxyribonuclease III